MTRFDGKPLTGRHVLAITLAAFGVIIAVNVLMAVKAVRTFPGLEVANSYVASQSFDRDRAVQTALGWRVEADYDGKEPGAGDPRRAGASRPDPRSCGDGRTTDLRGR